MAKPEITFKDILLSAFAVLIAVIGYFINARLTSIDESLKEFSSFQKTQIAISEKQNGDIRLLDAKHDELQRQIGELKQKVRL